MNEANDLQQKYMEFQMYEEQLNNMQKQFDQLEENLLEINYIKNSLDELSKVEKGKEILCPLSSGIFVKGEIKKSDEFLVNVGSNVVVKKNLEETKALMDKQKKELEGSKENLSLKYNEYYSRYQELKDELSKLVG